VTLTRSNDHEPNRHTILAKLFRDAETAERILAGEVPQPCACQACAAAAAG